LAVSVRVSLIRNTRTLHRRLERPLPFTWTKTPDGLLEPRPPLVRVAAMVLTMTRH